MTNYYALLEIPESLSPDPAMIEASWRDKNRSLSAEMEENGETVSRHSDLNQARTTLTDPTSCLAHWLALRAPSLTADRSIDPALMDLFAAISPVIEATDALLSRHRKATTALARAIMTREAINAQLKIQHLLEQIPPLRCPILDQFNAYEQEEATGSYKAASKRLGERKCLKGWEEQCRERLLALIAC